MKLKNLLTLHPALTFFIMLCAAAVMGLGSYNIFALLQVNVKLVLDYGVMALLDGALAEFGLLAFYGIVSLGAYIVFKACEKWLVERLLK